MGNLDSRTGPSVPLIYRQIADDSAFIGYDEYSQNVTDEDFQLYVLHLLKVEQFVMQVLLSDLPAFRMTVNHRGVTRLERLPLAKYFVLIDALFELASPDFEYSAQVDLFFRCCFTLELGKECFHNPLAYTSKGILKFELFNSLIDLIRAEAKKPAFKAKIAVKEQKADRQQASAEDLVAKLFRIYSKLQVLRIDFSYHSDYAKDMTAEKAKADLKRFLNNRRSKPRLFRNCVGYLWKLEWGPLKGFHFHVILFYKGREVFNDAYWSYLIGQYWQDNVTRGRGRFFSCNSRKSKYKRLGIGMINRTDLSKRTILLEDVIGYITKTEQFLRACCLGNERCFGTGQPHKKSNAGRPREGDDLIDDMDGGNPETLISSEDLMAA